MRDLLAEPRWLLLLLPLGALAAFAARAAWRGRRRRDLVALALRGLTLGLLVTTLAGPLGATRTRNVDVVFALDVSRSIDREAQAEALGLVNRALAAKAPDAYMGLVAFGADAGVEFMGREARGPVQALSVEVHRAHTDIARALETALAAFPAGGQRRIVLLSDGRENLGHARAAAAGARALGVEVDTVPLDSEVSGNEVRAEGVVAPARVRVHEPFELEVLLHSRRQARAHLVLMRNGAVIDEADLDLQPGSNAYSRVEQADEGGLFEYEAVVNSDRDGIQENNRTQTFVEVLGAPKVLHLIGAPGQGRQVSAALRAQGLTVEEMPGDALPATLHGLTDFDLIVIDNVSGFDLSLRKMRLLEEYVRDAGGGLVALGGDKSYSAGGYYGTPVERTLPVSMDVRSEARIPSVAVTIVLDRSGSMAGEQKLFIAKSAALAAIEVLSPVDEVGVLAFDDAPQWSVPPTRVSNRADIVERLRGIVSGGGTDLYRALEEVRRATRRQQAKIKHVIVLSDGLTERKADFKGLVRQLVQEGVTVSTVAFGQDADQGLLESIAAWGKGRFYFTADPANVPRIFTSETLVVSRDLHVEKTVVPHLVFPGEMLDGFPADAFPALGGYQRTFAKPAAQVLLAVDGDAPLLVSWRYGLGKAVAFMSDLTGRWGRRWVEWPDFTRFVGQMARWSMRRRGGESMTPEFSWEGERGTVDVDVLDRDDRFVNGLSLRGVAVGPEREPVPFALEQVAPGRYRGAFPVSDAGAYYVSLSGSNDTTRVGPRTFGLAVPYSPEYVQQGADRELLRALASETGGRLLPLGPGALDAILAPSREAVAGRTPIWRPLLLAALVLVVLEVAVRKVRLPEAWLARWGRKRPAAEVPDPGYEAWVRELDAAREAHLAALRQGRAYDSDDPAVRARLHIARTARR